MQFFWVGTVCTDVQPTLNQSRVFEGGPNRATFSISTFIIFYFLFSFNIAKKWTFYTLFHTIILKNKKHGSLFRKRSLLGPHLGFWQNVCQMSTSCDMWNLSKNCMRNWSQYRNLQWSYWKNKSGKPNHASVCGLTCTKPLVLICLCTCQCRQIMLFAQSKPGLWKKSAFSC